MMLTCRGANRFIADYLAGTLSDRQRIAFEHHIARCGRSCKTYLDQYRATVSMSRAAYSDDQVIEEAPEALIQAILAARAEGAG